MSVKGNVILLAVMSPVKPVRDEYRRMVKDAEDSDNVESCEELFSILPIYTE